MSHIKVAVPSNTPGGLEAGMSAHFGHCDMYTIVEVTDGAVTSVSTLANTGHEEGGCLAPVGHLAAAGVNALLSGGMGMRPLMGFKQAGIDVFAASGQPSVGQAVQAFVDEKLVPFSMDATCKGCGGHH